MCIMASQITSLTIVYSTFYSGADHRKHQSSTSLAFVWGIYRWPVNSPHKWPIMRKMFPFDDIIYRVFLYNLHIQSIIWVLNSLWPSDAICLHRSWSTLAQLMAGFLPAPSRNLTSHHKGLVTFIEGQFHKRYCSNQSVNCHENYSSRISFKSHWDNELNCMCCKDTL